MVNYHIRSHRVASLRLFLSSVGYFNKSHLIFRQNIISIKRFVRSNKLIILFTYTKFSLVHSPIFFMNSIFALRSKETEQESLSRYIWHQMLFWKFIYWNVLLANKLGAYSTSVVINYERVFFFLIKDFQTIVFILIGISTTIRPFFRYLSNLTLHRTSIYVLYWIHGGRLFWIR